VSPGDACAIAREIERHGFAFDPQPSLSPPSFDA
jgi:hypothetical protein